jgi:hypothetical protein
VCCAAGLKFFQKQNCTEACRDLATLKRHCTFRKKFYTTNPFKKDSHESPNKQYNAARVLFCKQLLNLFAGVSINTLRNQFVNWFSFFFFRAGIVSPATNISMLGFDFESVIPPLYVENMKLTPANRAAWLSKIQCCGSGSARIRNFLQDPDP